MSESRSLRSLEAEKIVYFLRGYENDPMWADHAEVPKNLLKRAADMIEARTARLRQIEGDIFDYVNGPPGPHVSQDEYLAWQQMIFEKLAAHVSSQASEGRGSP